MDSNLYKRTFFGLILITLIAIVFMMVFPFITAILTAMVFSFVFYPVYRRLEAKLNSKNIAAFITALMVVMILTIPFFFVLNTISKDAYSSYLLARQKVTSGNYFTDCPDPDNILCRAMNSLSERANSPQVKYYITTSLQGGITRVTEGVTDILLSIPVFILHSFISLFLLFFLFRDGKTLLKKMEKILPLKEKHTAQIMKKLNNMTSAVVYGSLVIALIQGTLGGIGFFIFGIPAPFLWGIVMAFAALIPYVGSTIIWLPAALYLLFEGYAAFDTLVIVKGILLLLYGIFVVGMVDNILKPKVIGDKGGLHPALVLLGVVGGLQFLGFIGVLVGPIIIAVFVAFVDIYEAETRIG